MDRRSANVATNVVISKEHKQKLQLLSKKTRITQSEYLREAVADLLEKYNEEFEGTRFDTKKKTKRGK